MLRELLQPRADAIAERWYEDSLTAYSPEALPVLRRQEDPFANPLGHTLREVTRTLLEALLDDGGIESTGESLDGVMRIRAVQELSPSRAIGFLFRVKELVRAELGEGAEDPRLRAELEALEARVDRIVLMAFDVFTECRERIHELRISEVKRNTPWFVGKTSFVVKEAP